MYKRALMSVMIVGFAHAVQLDKLDISVQGTVINTAGNTLGIAKDERLILLNGRTMNPTVRSLIKASEGKPTDLLVRITGNDVTVINDFSKTHIKLQPHLKKVFKNCFGFIAHEDGSCEYFCKGQSCQALGYVLNTQRNAVGIAAGDICYITPDHKTIRCLSGKAIKNPYGRESALTGTPGDLSGNGYIGYLVSKPSTPAVMGSGKRTDFYQR